MPDKPEDKKPEYVDLFEETMLSGPPRRAQRGRHRTCHQGQATAEPLATHPSRRLAGAESDAMATAVQ
jgi:hypothetical protein